MKKKYLAPKMELVLLESAEDMMDDITESGGEDPFGGRSFQAWLNDLPNGYIIDEDDLI